MNYNPAYPFYLNSINNPDNPALWVDGSTYSYRELAEQACRIAVWLRQATNSRATRVAILAHREICAYRGILGICWSGASYVPLNPAFPDQRLATIIESASPDVLIFDRKMLERATPELIRAYAGRILLADGDMDNIHGQSIACYGQLPEQVNITEPSFVDAEAEAYLVFTSGTTGKPNGVITRAGSLDFSIRALCERYPFVASDRFSQFFDLSFDFSVMDLFVSWGAGASTYVVPDAQKMAPGRFIVDNSLTVWTCVPSLIKIMAQMKLLKPGIFPSLRLSFFSGEMLAEAAARLWQAATSNGVVVNLYGQCETIIASLAHTCDLDAAVVDETRSVALGTQLEGIFVAIVNKDGSFAEPGIRGEIAVSGPHVATGYLENSQRTREKFRDLEHPSYGLRSWYITGDLARQDKEGVFHFLGRADNELKIRGHRVTLEEVEHHLRQCSGCDSVAVIPIRSDLGGIEALRGFIVAERCNEQKLKTSLRQSLPQPLVPKRIHPIRELPLSRNGKIDRAALALISAALD